MKSFLISSIFLIAALFSVSPLSAQKVFKPVTQALKAKKADEALRQLSALKKDSARCFDLELYNLGIEASLLKYEQENEKIYLQKSPDTIAFFRALGSAYDYALLADSLGLQDRVAPSAWKKFSRRALKLSKLYSNLTVAATHFYTRKDWLQAAYFSKLSLLVPSSRLFASALPQYDKSQLSRDAANYVFSNFKLCNYTEMDRFAELAIADTIQAFRIVEQLAEAKRELKDSAAYLGLLRRGVVQYPRRSYFAHKLAEYYFSKSQNDSVLAFTTTLLQSDSLNVFVYNLRAIAFLRLQQELRAIDAAQHMLRCDSAATDAYLLLGRANVALGRKTELPTSIHDKDYRSRSATRCAYFRQAQTALERFRTAQPTRKDLWREPLLSTYAALNLGREYEELMNDR